MKTALGLSASLPFCLAAACGSSDGGNDSAFKDPPFSNTPIVSDPGACVAGDGTAAGGAPAADLDACATSTAAAVAKPVVLVFAYDQSGSMAGNSRCRARCSAPRSTRPRRGPVQAARRRG